MQVVVVVVFYNFAFGLIASVRTCSFCASMMFPLIFNLPPMNAFMASSSPETNLRKSASDRVKVQPAFFFAGPCAVEWVKRKKQLFH